MTNLWRSIQRLFAFHISLSNGFFFLNILTGGNLFSYTLAKIVKVGHHENPYFSS